MQAESGVVCIFCLHVYTCVFQINFVNMECLRNDVRIHSLTHARTVSRLEWGSLRLAPIIQLLCTVPITRFPLFSIIIFHMITFLAMLTFLCSKIICNNSVIYMYLITTIVVQLTWHAQKPASYNKRSLSLEYIY